MVVKYLLYYPTYPTPRGMVVLHCTALPELQFMFALLLDGNGGGGELLKDSLL
jgi:hypothetical protein